jgi:hypothetical protein
VYRRIFSDEAMAWDRQKHVCDAVITSDMLHAYGNTRCFRH